MLKCPNRVRITVPLSEKTDPALVYIGRQWSLGGYHLKKSIWHNPFPLKDFKDDRQACLDAYYDYLMSDKCQKLRVQLSSLAGKTLMCFCKRDELCHGDVITYVGESLHLWVRETHYHN